MKKILCGTLAVLCMITLLVSCGAPKQPPFDDAPIKEPPEVGFLVAAQFDGYRVGYIDGLNTEDQIKAKIDNPELYKLSSVKEGVDALVNNRLHGLVLPASYANEEVEKNPNLSKLYQTFISEEVCAITLSEYKYSMQVNAAVTLMGNNGIAEKIAMKHSKNGTSDYTRPKDYDKVEGRVLRVGVPEGDHYPLVYKKNGELCGINIDTAYEMAKGMYGDVEFAEYKDDEALFKALSAGEIDIALSKFVPSEENPISSKYFYTHPYSEQSVHILINGPTPAAADGLGAILAQ